jgi:hypothetical protein
MVAERALGRVVDIIPVLHYIDTQKRFWGVNRGLDHRRLANCGFPLFTRHMGVSRGPDHDFVTGGISIGSWILQALHGEFHVDIIC